MKKTKAPIKAPAPIAAPPLPPAPLPPKPGFWKRLGTGAAELLGSFLYRGPR